MTMGGGWGGLSHTQSGSVCSLPQEVEFLNSHRLMTTFNQFTLPEHVRADDMSYIRVY